MTESDYNQDRKLLFETQSRHEAGIERLYTKVNKMTVDIAVLKVKAALWGGIAGLVLGALGELVLRKLNP